MQRREFLQKTTASAAALAAVHMATEPAVSRAANDKVTVCVAGVRGRGNGLLTTFARLPTAEVKYVCDIDEGVLKNRAEWVASNTGKKPEAIKDFQTALDDKEVQALVLGTPDHWHAIPTIRACQAGKDVYVEKPDGHNIMEGRTMVEAARKYKRIVQLGTQASGGAHHKSAMEYIKADNIGKAVYAKAWESAKQGAIPRVADSDPPAGVDYDLWLGPAPKRPFNRMRFHGNWRWFFDYGSGDLGNDGVHRLDFARWMLETAVAAQGGKPPTFPRGISAMGGKYYFDDAQEWPDTYSVNYDYDGRILTYEMRIWAGYQFLGESEGASIYGDNGYVVLGNTRWRAYDAKGNIIPDVGSLSTAAKNPEYTAVHAQNFIDCMHSRERPNADLETVGHPSSMLCHLGNAAWRVGRQVKFDLETYTFVDDPEANKYLTRPEYRKPWTLPKLSEG